MLQGDDVNMDSEQFLDSEAVTSKKSDKAKVNKSLLCLLKRAKTDIAVLLTSRRLTARWICCGLRCAGGQQEAQDTSKEGTGEEGKVI